MSLGRYLHNADLKSTRDNTEQNIMQFYIKRQVYRTDFYFTRAHHWGRHGCGEVYYIVNLQKIYVIKRIGLNYVLSTGLWSWKLVAEYGKHISIHTWINKILSKWLSTEQQLKQGCVIFHWVFNLFIDKYAFGYY